MCSGRHARNGSDRGESAHKVGDDMTDEVRPDPMPRKRRRGAAGLLDSFLDSPISGLAPWIVLAVFAGSGHFKEAISAVFGFSLLMLWASRRRGDRLHSLSVFGVVCFGALLLVRVSAGPGSEPWLSSWTGTLSNIALAVFATGTLLIRRPFTLSYAKETTPEEFWELPGFYRTNLVISAVWAASFAVGAVLGVIGNVVLHDSDNFWTGWILQLGATFFAMAVTGVYPDYAGVKMEREAGITTEPLPSLLPFIDWLPMYVLITGIIGWVFDEVPDWLGITLIVVGAIGVAALRKFAPSAEREPSG
jgi:hypothetical protein